MKKILIIITILWITTSETKADVIFSPYTNFGLAYSLEGIGSYEILQK